LEEMNKAPGKDDRVTATRDKLNTYREAQELLKKREYSKTQAGKLGVDLSVQTDGLRNQSRLELTALRQVQGRNVGEVGGVWIDDGFTPKTKAVVIKAQSNAYFRILQKRPEVKDVFRLGNHLVWVTPSGTALVVDTSDGKDELADKEIDKLFTAKK